MRWLCIVLSCMLLALPFAIAEELATTYSGRKVLLKDDGTWTYVDRSTPNTASGDANIEQTIRAFCLGEWHDNFDMRAYCEKKQREAVRVLASGKPNDIAQNDFVTVRRHCAGEWPNNFDMRAYCERQQFKAIRDLRR
jgi:hypothetical protein